MSEQGQQSFFDPDKLSLDALNYLEFRPTPWDSRAFGFATNEILRVSCSAPERLDELLALFDAHSRKASIRFSYIRVDGADIPLKAAVQRNGFYYAETSLLLSWRNRNAQTALTPLKTGFTLETPEEGDFERIREIARDSFSHSRFHEDGNIGGEKARLRYYLWIDDLRKQGKKFLVYKAGGTVQSFLAYTFEDGKLTLILAGSDRAAGFLSCYFWDAFMAHFAAAGCRKAVALVSAANINIVNLYGRLHFECEKMYAGFHKFYF